MPHTEQAARHGHPACTVASMSGGPPSPPPPPRQRPGFAWRRHQWRRGGGRRGIGVGRRRRIGIVHVAHVGSDAGRGRRLGFRLMYWDCGRLQSHYLKISKIFCWVINLFPKKKWTPPSSINSPVPSPPRQPRLPLSAHRPLPLHYSSLPRPQLKQPDMSGSYSSRLRAGASAGGGLGATTVLAAKVAFASAALAAAASLLRAVLPQLVSGADAFLWKLYLFVTVHVIIFVIWKLSDNKHFHAAAHKDPWAPVPHNPAPTLLTEVAAPKTMKRKVDFAPADGVVRGEEFRVLPPVSRPHDAAIAARAEGYRVPPPVSRPHLEASASPVDEGVVSPGSCGAESCVTTESEGDAASSDVAASAYVPAADAWRSVAHVPERAVIERGLSLPPPQAMAATAEHFDGGDHDEGGGDDDLDATWNAIMQKTRPATAPASSSPSAPAPRSSPPRPAPSPRPRAREPSVGAAELSKRSEDFIKKIHNSFGRHQ
uniref:Uncharacterized protein n=1 Tax=Avena sativa TaxID=4498 RepID=A0ACD5Z3G9_AVESA